MDVMDDECEHTTYYTCSKMDMLIRSDNKKYEEK